PTSPGGQPSAAPSLPLAGVVLRVDVFDGPRPLAVDLDDRLAPGPAEVLHAGRHAGVGPCGQRRALLLLQLATHAPLHCPPQDPAGHAVPSFSSNLPPMPR